MSTHIITPHEVEERIGRCLIEMEERTADYARLAEEAAEAEADYRKQHAVMTLGVISRHDKMSVQERTARVDAGTADAHRRYLVAKAARDSCRESLTSLRETLSGLRTLSVNTRQLAQ